MTANDKRLLIVALAMLPSTLLLIGACNNIQSSTPPPVTAVGDADLTHITSACDQYGNRVYRYVDKIAVVGQDPTCKGAPR